MCRARPHAVLRVSAGRAYADMAVFLRLIPVVFYLMRLSRTPRARMLYARARDVARSPEGRALLAHAQRAARDPGAASHCDSWWRGLEKVDGQQYMTDTAGDSTNASTTRSSSALRILLLDAEGNDRELSQDEFDRESLSDQRLVWVDMPSGSKDRDIARDRAFLEQLGAPEDALDALLEVSWSATPV